jgi:hypothetical protein
MGKNRAGSNPVLKLLRAPCGTNPGFGLAGCGLGLSMVRRGTPEGSGARTTEGADARDPGTLPCRSLCRVTIRHTVTYYRCVHRAPVYPLTNLEDREKNATRPDTGVKRENWRGGSWGVVCAGPGGARGAPTGEKGAAFQGALSS